MSNVRTFTGPQQEVAGTLPNNYSLGGGNMKADYKVATNIVPNTEARWKDVNTRGRGGDVLRQETQAHVCCPNSHSTPRRCHAQARLLTAFFFGRLLVAACCRRLIFLQTSLTCMQAQMNPTTRCTHLTKALTSRMCKLSHIDDFQSR